MLQLLVGGGLDLLAEVAYGDGVPAAPDLAAFSD